MHCGRGDIMAGQFTRRVTWADEQLTQDQVGLTGRTIAYEVGAAKLLTADKSNHQYVTLSAGLSAYPLAIAPLGVSSPALLVMVTTDQPVDVRTNAPSD